MIYPNFIKKDDLIDVPAPSDGSWNNIDEIRFRNAEKQMKELGYKINLSKNIFNSNKARSASAEERGNEFNIMLKNNSSMIFCAAGGEFLVEMLPYVDFKLIKENVKWIEGFSDPTGIIMPITTLFDVSTIYGNNFKSYGMEPICDSLKDNLKILHGNIIEQKSYNMYENERIEKVTGTEGYNLDQKVEWKSNIENKIEIKGRILAGCIDIMSELAGTKYDGIPQFIEKYKEDGTIFAFDNCELSKEELIRTLWKFNELGYFKYTRGIIFGRNGIDDSCIGYDMKTMLEDSVISNIPIIYDADISHKGPCMTFINGSIATVEYNDGKGKVKFELK